MHRQDNRSRTLCQGLPEHGRLAGDVLKKHHARGSEHRLRKPPAWAIDLDDLDAAEALGALYVNIRDTEARRHYWAALSTIRARGVTLERGRGEQVALTLEWWRPTRAAAERLAQGGVPAPSQQGLWGVP